MSNSANDNSQRIANDNRIREQALASLDLLDAIDWWREDASIVGSRVLDDSSGFPYLPPDWTYQSA